MWNSFTLVDIGIDLKGLKMSFTWSRSHLIEKCHYITKVAQSSRKWGYGCRSGHIISRKVRSKGPTNGFFEKINSETNKKSCFKTLLTAAGLWASYALVDKIIIFFRQHHLISIKHSFFHACDPLYRLNQPTQMLDWLLFLVPLAFLKVILH